MTAEETYFLGNSQLISSLIAAYTPPSAREQSDRDWADGQRISKGVLELPGGRAATYLSCNMVALGDVEDASGTLHFTNGMRAFLDMVDPAVRTVVVMLRGNEFAIESLVDTAPRWDFIYDGRAADPSRLFVQWKDAAAHFDAITASLYATVLLVRLRFAQAKVCYVVAPPPLTSGSRHLDEDTLSHYPAAENETFGDLVRAHGLRPFELRRKIYDAMHDRLTRRLHAAGVEVFASPADSITDAGALKEEYAADFLHGNGLYGQALARQLDEFYADAPLQATA